jgi:hypothetical protein
MIPGPGPGAYSTRLQRRQRPVRPAPAHGRVRGGDRLLRDRDLINLRRFSCVSTDVRPSHMTPAVCALLGLSLTTAACGAGNASTAASPHAAPKATSASTTTPPGSSHPTAMAPSPATTPPPPSISSASSPPSTPLPPPGAVADCTSALPHRLSTRPSAITLACADNGWGVEEMTWTSWTTSAATGHGTFWDKLCEPSCASGKIGTYPIVVTLSAVKTSSQGPWFSRLTVTWEATRPPSPVPDSFLLTPPRN